MVIPGFDGWEIEGPPAPVKLPTSDLSGEALAKYLNDYVAQAFDYNKERLQKLEAWGTGKQPETRNHTHPNSEKRVLQRFARNPWMRLMVDTFAQQLYVAGYRQEGSKQNEEAWQTWEFNDMKTQQLAVARATMIYGYSYVRVTDGLGPSGESMAVLRGVDPQNAFGIYDDPFAEYPLYMLEKRYNGTYRWWTETGYSIINRVDGEFQFISAHAHSYGVVPFVRYVNQVDLQGRCWGDVEPLVELAARMDKTIFDRLLVQHYNSFKIRWAIGLEQPDSEEAIAGQKFRMANETVLVSSNPDAEFGTLDETRMDPFIAAYKNDLESFLNNAQLPPELAGLVANLSADAMAGARRSTEQKLYEKQTVLGQAHARVMRLAARIEGRGDDANDFSARIHWQDMSVTSLAQFADAWGKMCDQLGVPRWAAWRRIPDVDQAELKEWEDRYFEDDKLVKFLREWDAKPSGQTPGAGGTTAMQNQPKPNVEE